MSKTLSGVKAGILYMLAAMFIFSSLSVIVKEISHIYPVWEVVLFRTFFALPPALYLVKREGGLDRLKVHNLRALAMLGILGATALYFLFMAFKSLPLADATAIAYTSILFITALSVPILKEHVGFERWLAITLGFVGVTIMASPEGNINVNCVYPLGFALVDAVLMISLRLLTRETPSSIIVFYYSLFASLVSGVFTLFEWKTPDLYHWVLLIIMGVGSGCGQLFLTNAYRDAPAVVVSPMCYSSILWGTLFGFFIFGEEPTWSLGIGAALIISAGVFIIYRESTPASKEV